MSFSFLCYYPNEGLHSMFQLNCENLSGLDRFQPSYFGWNLSVINWGLLSWCKPLFKRGKFPYFRPVTPFLSSNEFCWITLHLSDQVFAAGTTISQNLNLKIAFATSCKLAFLVQKRNPLLKPPSSTTVIFRHIYRTVRKATSVLITIAGTSDPRFP